MFNQIEIARARYIDLEAKYHYPREVEGMTVQAPNMIDRMMMAAHALLPGYQAMVQQQYMAPHQCGAIAS
jgi:hypothetical protein